MLCSNNSVDPMTFDYFLIGLLPSKRLAAFIAQAWQ